MKREQPAVTKKNDVPGETSDIEQGIVLFTEQEIERMPRKIQKLIIIDKKRCRIRKKQSGKNSFTYEIRFRRDGFDFSACGVTLELAKANFIEKAKLAKPKSSSDHKVPTTFNAFSLYYFENFRKEKVAEKTMYGDRNRYERYLNPYFKEIPLKKITPSDCKNVLTPVKEKGKGKTADELYSLMNAIFKSAIAHNLIERNPLATVFHLQHERVEGKALLPEDEKRLLELLPTSDCAVEIALSLFCGLRPNEVENKEHPPVIEGSFIKAINSKRHFRDKSKIEYKYIPICPRLRSFIGEKIVITHTAQITLRHFKKIMPGYKLKDLRTTFYTKCQIFGVAEPALKEFMGHSFGKLGNAYSDLKKYGDYLLKEGSKLSNW